MENEKNLNDEKELKQNNNNDTPNTTKEQEEMFAKTFGCCRKIWNLMLTDKIEHYKATKEMLITSVCFGQNKIALKH